jgi:hypothetical protein
LHAKAAIVVGGFLAAFGSLASHAAPTLPAATNLSSDARQATQQGIPIVILISLDGCTHCETIRASHLAPLARTKPARAIVRQAELTAATPLIDFDGRKTTHTAFARAHGAKIAPVVLFFDAKGKRIADPLIGASIPDFYGAYFERALLESQKAMSALPPLEKREGGELKDAKAK